MIAAGQPRGADEAAGLRVRMRTSRQPSSGALLDVGKALVGDDPVEIAWNLSAGKALKGAQFIWSGGKWVVTTAVPWTARQLGRGARWTWNTGRDIGSRGIQRGQRLIRDARQGFETWRGRRIVAGADRLKDHELATASRLSRHPAFKGRTWRQSAHEGEEVLDDLDRRYEFYGSPAASDNWSEGESLRSLRRHVLEKSGIDFNVVDVTGYKSEHKAVIARYLNALPPEAQSSVIRLGFR